MFCFSHCTALHVSTNIKEIEGISYYRYDLFINGKTGDSGEEKLQVRCIYGLVKHTAVATSNVINAVQFILIATRVGNKLLDWMLVKTVMS